MNLVSLEYEDIFYKTIELLSLVNDSARHETTNVTRCQQYVSGMGAVVRFAATPPHGWLRRDATYLR